MATNDRHFVDGVDGVDGLDGAGVAVNLHQSDGRKVHMVI